MRIALASLIPSRNAAENVRLLLHSLEALEDSAELIIFGRQFLQNSDQTGLPETARYSTPFARPPRGIGRVFRLATMNRRRMV